MFNILYVCTGNTCRSPMAVGLLRKILAEEGITEVEVTSAGIATLDGYPATDKAIRVAGKRKGVDISGHHSTKMTETLAHNADLIFALSHEHFEFIQERGSVADKLFLVKAFPEAGHADFLHSIKDPIGGTLGDYKRVIDELEREIKRALPAIREKITARVT